MAASVSVSTVDAALDGPGYRERGSRVPGAVLWSRRVVAAGPGLVLPDGCMDLIWRDGELLVAGPDTVAQPVSGTPGVSFTGLRFAPGTGPAVFGLPAAELRDQRVPLAALWPGATVRELTERTGAATDLGRALESIAAARLAAAPAPGTPDLTGAGGIARLLGAGEPVAAVAAALGLGARQLHRRCLAAFGYGPKTLARVLRLDRALALARAGVPLAEVAARTGYADQAHLARDTRGLAGVPMRTLLG